MAVLAFEGFDHLTAGGAEGLLMVKPGWFAPTGTPTALTRQGGLSASGFSVSSNNNVNYVGVNGGVNATTLIAGLRYELQIWDTPATQVIAAFYDGNSAQCGIGLTTTQKLFFWRGTTGTVIATGTTSLGVGAIYFIDMKVTFATTAVGSFEVRINGIVEPNLSGTANTQTAATANVYAQSVCFGKTTFGVQQIWDDLHLNDDSGSVGNSYLATSTTAIRVETLFPTANDSVTFTPLTSTNVSQVQEVAWDGDATYNSSAASGNIDTFTHGALSSTPSTIFAVAVASGMRKDDVTAQTARTKLISGATTSDGATKTMLTTYLCPQDYYLTDPNTAGSAWTATTVNAAKIGYEHI